MNWAGFLFEKLKEKLKDVCNIVLLIDMKQKAYNFRNNNLLIWEPSMTREILLTVKESGPKHPVGPLCI